MKFSKLVAFLMAVVLCIGAVTVSFAERTEWTEELSDKLFSIACKALKGEGYRVDTYDECESEVVNNTKWHTFRKNGKMKWRCDVTPKGYVTNLVNYDFYQIYQSDREVRNAKTAKKSEIRKAMNKINSFLKKYNPKLLKRVKKLKLDQVIVKGKNRYLDYSDQEWQGMQFMIRVYPSVRIEVFSAPLY